MTRLRKFAETKILHLRRKAPKFYSGGLITIINQAASQLRIHATNQKQFNVTHSIFLHILDELAKGQPPSDKASFGAESERWLEKTRLMQKQLTLRREIDKLMAAEVSLDELGDEDEDSNYIRHTNLLAEKEHELDVVSKEIKRLQGERWKENIRVDFTYTQGSLLNKLTEEQRYDLKQQLTVVLGEKEDTVDSIFLNDIPIEEMIENLKLNPKEFPPEILKELAKDTLEALKRNRRKIKQERRDKFHEDLLRSEYLRPREGIILDNPDDLPDHIKKELDDNDTRMVSQISAVVEKYANQQPLNAEEDAEDVDIEEEDEEEQEYLDARMDMSAQGDVIDEDDCNFDRCKEEPRDDYVQKNEDDDSNDEVIIDEDDDIECLGVIEPKDKIATIELD